jgi:hypothetical protein
VFRTNPDDPPPRELETYRDDPVGFFVEVLGFYPTPDQATIARAVPGNRVKVNSGHGIGKTALAAALCVWWFYTRNPAVIVTTAPKQHHVETVLWGEIRTLVARARRPLRNFLQPKAAKMFDHPDHWAEGFTSSAGEGFQGRHRPSMFFIFDECEGVAPFYWETTSTMFQPNRDHAWLAIGNPTTTSSQSYVEDRATDRNKNPKWKLFNLSALNHPNILAQLEGKPAPIPDAVTLEQVDTWIGDWCEPVPIRDRRPRDLEWPPNSGNWFRPSPSFLARVMGIRPTEGVDTVWGARAWEEACYPRWTPEVCWLRGSGITVGVDTAAYGDDMTALHVRTGPLSVHHESHNGWGPQAIADRISELSIEWAAWYNRYSNPESTGRLELQPRDVRVTIELDGMGAAVIELCKGRGRWGGVKAGESSDDLDSLGTKKYANKRAEMWFKGRDRAMKGQMDLSRLPKPVRDRLENQLLTPAYKLLPGGAVQVEPKEDIKKRLKRSPDDADALLVCYYDGEVWSPTAVFRNPEELKR